LALLYLIKIHTFKKVFFIFTFHHAFLSILEVLVYF